MEAELQNPGDYRRGKEKVSMLIVGFYCSKKQAHEEGAGFQVSSMHNDLNDSRQIVGFAVGRLGEDVCLASRGLDGPRLHHCNLKTGEFAGEVDAGCTA